MEKLVSLASSKERKTLLDTKHDCSQNKQCKLLHINKSSLYYKPTKPFSTGKDIKLLDAIITSTQIFQPMTQEEYTLSSSETVIVLERSSLEKLCEVHGY